MKHKKVVERTCDEKRIGGAYTHSNSRSLPAPSNEPNVEVIILVLVRAKRLVKVAYILHKGSLQKPWVHLNAVDIDDILGLIKILCEKFYHRLAFLDCCHWKGGCGHEQVEGVGVNIITKSIDTSTNEKSDEMQIDDQPPIA